MIIVLNASYTTHILHDVYLSCVCSRPYPIFFAWSRVDLHATITDKSQVRCDDSVTVQGSCCPCLRPSEVSLTYLCYRCMHSAL